MIVTKQFEAVSTAENKQDQMWEWLELIHIMYQKVCGSMKPLPSWVHQFDPFYSFCRGFRTVDGPNSFWLPQTVIPKDDLLMGSVSMAQGHQQSAWGFRSVS